MQIRISFIIRNPQKGRFSKGGSATRVFVRARRRQGLCKGCVCCFSIPPKMQGMHVCVFTYTYTYTYTFTCIYIYAHTHANTHTCMHTRMHACMHADLHIDMNADLYACVYKYTHTHPHIINSFGCFPITQRFLDSSLSES